MKKTYTKPVIMFESFALSTNIAAGCEFEANFSSGNCGYVVNSPRGERVVFVDSSTGCTSRVQYDYNYQDFVLIKDNNQICYHVPAPESNLFNS